MPSDHNQRPQIIIHGGAVMSLGADREPQLSFLEAVCADAFAALGAGHSALDVVEAAIERLERSGLFVAGKGSSPNTANIHELDASIMDGSTARAGAVAAAKNAAAAIPLARLTMERTPHVLLVGNGVSAAFADRADLFVSDPGAYYSPAGAERKRSDGPAHGTVGAVARDRAGRLAAATATGGTFGKLPGRVGDSPIIGAGTWADNSVAVSCTGHGESFIRTLAAGSMASRIRFAGMAVQPAADAAMADVAAVGGAGGLIAAHIGGVVWAYNSKGLLRAWIDDTGQCRSAVD